METKMTRVANTVRRSLCIAVGIGVSLAALPASGEVIGTLKGVSETWRTTAGVEVECVTIWFWTPLRSFFGISQYAGFTPPPVLGKILRDESGRITSNSSFHPSMDFRGEKTVDTCIDEACTQKSFVSVVTEDQVVSGFLRDQINTALQGRTWRITGDYWQGPLTEETRYRAAWDCLADPRGGGTFIKEPGPPSKKEELRGSLNTFVLEPTPAGDAVENSSDASFANPISETDEATSVSVTFDEVVTSGESAVIAQSNSEATLPGNFALSRGEFQATVLDIATTAEFTPPIRICSSYDDADDDGIVDGTDVPESELRLLHGEDGSFVDRTVSRDFEANVICAEVEHLSPFTVVPKTSTSMCGQSPKSGCRAAGKATVKLLRGGSDRKKDSLAWTWSKAEQTLPAEFGNPRADTNTELCVYDASGAVVGARVAAGAFAGWGLTFKNGAGTGFAFKDKRGSYDGLKLVALAGQSAVAKSSIKVLASGPNLNPERRQLTPPVTVQVVNDSAGGSCFEAVFPAAKVGKNTPAKFQAKLP